MKRAQKTILIYTAVFALGFLANIIIVNLAGERTAEEKEAKKYSGIHLEMIRGGMSYADQGDEKAMIKWDQTVSIKLDSVLANQKKILKHEQNEPEIMRLYNLQIVNALNENSRR
jgi:hypothetical protein